MKRNTVEHIIRKFGSQQRVAELLGIWQTAVSGWVRRGAIPARRQAELLAAARREGIELGPADFFAEEAALADGTHGSATMAALHAAARATPESRHHHHLTESRSFHEQGLRTVMSSTSSPKSSS